MKYTYVTKYHNGQEITICKTNIPFDELIAEFKKKFKNFCYIPERLEYSDKILILSI